MTKANELRELKVEDLEVRLEEARQELFNLRFQHATNQLDNTARLGQVRKEISRLSALLWHAPTPKSKARSDATSTVAKTPMDPSTARGDEKKISGEGDGCGEDNDFDAPSKSTGKRGRSSTQKAKKP